MHGVPRPPNPPGLRCWKTLALRPVSESLVLKSESNKSRGVFCSARSEQKVLAGVQGRGAHGAGGRGRGLLPPTHTKCKLASQAGKLEIVGDLRKRGAAVEGGSLLRLVAPSPSRVPPGAQGCPAFPGGGVEARCDGWVASRVAARPSLRRSLPPGTPFLLPRASYINCKGLKTEGQLPRAGTWRRSGAPLSPPSPPCPSSSDSTSRLDLVVHKQCSPILAVSGRRACARQAGGLSGG